MSGARPVRVLRDETTIAVGALLPSGTVVVEWRREAFPPAEQTAEPVVSHYASVDDAVEATGGAVAFDDPPDLDEVEEQILASAEGEEVAP